MFSFLKPSWCNLYSVSHELDCKSELKHIYNILMEEKKYEQNSSRKSHCILEYK